MRDYRRTLAEMARVLAPGRAGGFRGAGVPALDLSRDDPVHQGLQERRPDWIERDVVLEEIDAIGREAGFSELVVRPLLPAELREYPLSVLA